MPKTKNNKVAGAYIALILAQIFWGISFVWSKELLNNNFHVIFIITTRLIISFISLGIIAIITKKLEIVKREDLKKFILLSFFQPFLYFIGENYGLKFVDASYVAIFIAIIPVIIPFGMLIFYKQPLSWSIIIGVVISVIGITVLSMEHFSAGKLTLVGILVLMLAVFSAVGYNMVLFKLFKYRPITIIIYQNAIATIFYLPLFFFIDKGELTAMNWTPNTIFALVMLALFCSSIAFMGYSYAVKNIPIPKASVFGNLIPVITIIFAFIIGQETISINKLVGMSIVIFGVLISQIFSKRSATNKNPS